MKTPKAKEPLSSIPDKKSKVMKDAVSYPSHQLVTEPGPEPRFLTPGLLHYIGQYKLFKCHKFLKTILWIT